MYDAPRVVLCSDMVATDHLLAGKITETMLFIFVLAFVADTYQKDAKPHLIAQWGNERDTITELTSANLTLYITANHYEPCGYVPGHIQKFQFALAHSEADHVLHKYVANNTTRNLKLFNIHQSTENYDWLIMFQLLRTLPAAVFDEFGSKNSGEISWY